MKRHGQLARDELSESMDHLRMAAAHAASSAAAALAPRLDTAKKAASEGFDSLVDAARDSARNANVVVRRGKAKVTRKKEAEKARKRWSTVGGVLVAGAAAGTAGTLFSRWRARQQRWNEYATTPTRTGAVTESAGPGSPLTTGTKPETGSFGQYGQTAGTASKNSRP